MPDLSTGNPQEIWNRYFDTHRPAPKLVCDWVAKLHGDRQHVQVIALLQAALIHGQAQPWMYEVLALSMELENYPKEAVERVVLSLTDFGQVNYESMMYSGAYLSRFGRKGAALKMYQQSSRMLPERPEPYLLGLKLAQEAGTPADVEWAATGILVNCWEAGQQKLRRDAENAMFESIRQLRRQGDATSAAAFEQSLAIARSADLEIRVEWHGDADLDLSVEEPDGSVCSFETPATRGGGLFLHDGLGPDTKEAYELYVCPRGLSGAYRIVVKSTLGRPVGDRAVVTATLRSGQKDQERIVRTLSLTGGEASLTIDLKEGRRTQLRLLSQDNPPPGVELDRLMQLSRGPQQRPRVNPDAQQAMTDFQRSRQFRAGAVGYAPTVITLLDGTTMTGQAVISADRRYVRLSLQPQVSSITDVFTFSFLNGIPAP